MHQEQHSGTVGGRRWPAWGAAAGVLAVGSHMVLQPVLTPADRARPVTVTLAELDHRMYAVAAVLGYAAVGCLLVAAAGWARWAAARPDSLAARVVALGLLATAGAGVIAYGIKGMLAVYLPGGLNAAEFPPEGTAVLFVLDDLLAYLAWFGAGVSVLAVAWLALRERALPRWVGALGLLALLPPVGLLVAFGLPGLFGVTVPLWMIITGTALAVRGSAPVLVREPAGVPA